MPDHRQDIIHFSGKNKLMKFIKNSYDSGENTEEKK